MPPHSTRGTNNGLACSGAATTTVSPTTAGGSSSSPPLSTLPLSKGETEKRLACGSCSNNHQPIHRRTGESKHEGNKPIVALITIPTLFHPIPHLHDLKLTARPSPASNAVSISVFGWIGVWVGFGRG
ncbi:hypothetical protein ACP275_05G088100 [Erythranthe tilingii]